jgi:hypothetical protein
VAFTFKILADGLVKRADRASQAIFSERFLPATGSNLWPVFC